MINGNNMQKIIIKNLLVVKDFEMEINKFNLIIGEQSSGKSKISKDIYLMKILSTDLKYAIYEELHEFTIDHFTQQLKNNIINFFGDLINIDDNMYIKFQYNKNTYIEIKKDNNLIINYSSNILNFIKVLIDKLPIISEKEILKNQDFKIINFLNTKIGIEIENFFENYFTSYYIPASRSIINLLNKQKTKLDYKVIGLYNSLYMQMVETIQPFFKEGNKWLFNDISNNNLKMFLESMCNKVIKYLGGEYFYNNGDSYIKLENSNKKIPINYLSSGQQEMLWLLNILISIISANIQRAFIIIEEPEAHLYPKMQKEIIDFIVNFMNMTNSSILITTHSPYILTSTNNLLYAGKLKENYKYNKEKIEKINNIVGEYGAINPNEINAFKLYLNDFKYTNIINDENEINCEEIDDISNTINETYTKLFDMELNNGQ